MNTDMQFVSRLSTSGEAKILLLVLDGVGGLPHPETGLTELETASTPNLDTLAREGICGLVHAVAPGITPGSGPGHLGLFGYDPIRWDVGRGVLSALGTGLEIGPEDVAARANFCTVENGVVTDRRAGRISTEENARLCSLLDGLEIDGVKVTIRPEKEHRAALVLRGEGLSDRITDTDPQREGKPPLRSRPLPGGGKEAERTAELVNRYLDRAAEILSGEHPANMLITRGFARKPDIPRLPDLYGLRAGAVATYPMYRALALLVGMELIECGDSLEEEVAALERAWGRYDFFFFHYKYTDSRGEDGDFEAKVRCIEEVDAALPRLLQLQPDVLVVTGDHSTPAVLRMHSWHPSPVILRSRWERRDDVAEFSERECAKGGLGTIPAVALMPLMLANALRLNKYGA
jgi:2,3-bisphosphoglycerate-independent phosphoglycerate mutase